MSRKRAKKPVKQAVPDEILAEGSGPHADVVEVAAEAAPVVDVVEAAAIEAEAAEVLETLVAVEGEQAPQMADDGTLAVSVAPAEGADVAADADAVLEEEAEVEGAVLPTSAASMDDAQLKHLVEALVFASDKPVTLLRLRQLTRVADVRRLEAALAELTADFAERGLILQQVSGGYQFRTQTRYSAWVQQLIAGRPVRLSRAQLETLAIIAYRQPITRPEIDEIRGVDSSGTLKVLLDRALVRILGKKEEVGRPMLYGTTKEFLDFFSLGDLRELPTLREYSELTPESKRVMTDKLGVAPEEAGPSAEMLAEAEAIADATSPEDEVKGPADDELAEPFGDDVELRAEPFGDDAELRAESPDEGALAADAEVASDADAALAAEGAPEGEVVLDAGGALEAEVALAAEAAPEGEVALDAAVALHAGVAIDAGDAIDAEVALEAGDAVALDADDAQDTDGAREAELADGEIADDDLADPALLAEAAAVARALASDHDDVDTEIAAASDAGDDDLTSPPLDPSDDLLAEPDPRDDVVD